MSALLVLTAMDLRVMFVLVFVVAVINLGEAKYKCYTCSKCGDPFDAKQNVTTCESEYGCLKSTANLFGTKFITRTCAASKSNVKGCVGAFGNSVCFCEKDLCNSASFQHATVSAVIILLACVGIAVRML